MSIDQEDPHCPECGEPIGQTATYCMHCSADLTEARERADKDGDGVWDEAEPAAPSEQEQSATTPERDIGPTPENPLDSSEQILDPDGVVDNTLTVIVGIAGGIVVGLVGTFVLAVLTGSAISILFGLALWLGATAYLVRRRTVQGAVAKSGYAVAVVLLCVPLIAISPFADVSGGIEGRGSLFVIMLLFAGVPAAIAAAVGWAASQYVPDGPSSEG